ncbi:hypothetical protein AX769_05750 [Frondihabitans sp. PAMC 28766]|uniref:hypothetical protein n=1 Tax=Frondihabitans sp. PAMC 28766 TaxID=1795630 RepID=UPI00078B251D|nr:hypothetical protein [Frondihabitans sp. PAMC 28766]AMM19741.1 hypothetical protein AX769_05750 [Frondihabitans sp. PAMC 28766]
MSIIAVVLVALVSGYRVWSNVNERTQTAAAFSALRIVDKRIDLPSEIPDTTRTESGLAVRRGGSGNGPTIVYSFAAADTPDWEARFHAAMYRAGYGKGDEPWSLRVRGYDVTVLSAGPDDSNGRVYISISTL